MEEFEECLQYNEDDISDIKLDNRKLENDVSELRKQLMYMETYSIRENLKFFGLPENSDALDSSNDMEEESSRQSGTSENTREVLYKFREEWLKIDRPRDKIGFQIVHGPRPPKLGFLYQLEGPVLLWNFSIYIYRSLRKSMISRLNR